MVTTLKPMLTCYSEHNFLLYVGKKRKMEIDLTDNESDVGNTQYYTKGSTYNYRNNYSTNYFEHHKDFFNTDGEAWV